MTTIYDWLTLAAFGGLVVLFLQRSVEEGQKRDHAYQYILPTLCCPAANYLGNHGHGLVAMLILVVAAGYVVLVLNPFDNKPRGHV